MFVCSNSIYIYFGRLTVVKKDDVFTAFKLVNGYFLTINAWFSQ